MGQGQNTGPQDRGGVENKVPTEKEEWEKGVVAVAVVVTLTLVTHICPSVRWKTSREPWLLSLMPLELVNFCYDKIT